MRVTIIVSDNAVGKDGVFHNNLNLSSCNIPSEVWALQWDESSGHIEFNTPIPNQEITSLPVWAEACLEVWNVANTPIPSTPEQIIAATKVQAENLLFESDWSVLPDVPLQNKLDWEAYRASLRQIAINPTVNPNWPVKPQSIWS